MFSSHGCCFLNPVWSKAPLNDGLITFSPIEKSLGWSSTNSVSITALWQQPKPPPTLGFPHQVALYVWYLSKWTCKISETYQRWPTARCYKIPTNWARFVWKCAGAFWQIQNWAPRAAAAEETRSSRRGVSRCCSTIQQELLTHISPTFLLHYSWQWVRAGRARACRAPWYVCLSTRTDGHAD